MTVLSVRGRLIRAVLALCCFGLLVQMQVGALIMVGGDSPVEDRDWPKGVVDVANLPSRYRWTEGPPFGGGEFRFEYVGAAYAFNEALERFAEIRAPKLDLVIHDGPGLNYAANEDEQQGVDWAFTIWVRRNFYRLKNPRVHLCAERPGYGDPLPPPRVDVYVGGGGAINWSKVEIPANIDVTDKRASTAGYTPADGGVLVGSVYDMGTGKPIEGARVYLVHYRGDPKPETSPTATVDEDGVFELKRVPKGSYRVSVQARGYAIREAGYYTNRDYSYEKMVVYLAKEFSVEGQVVDPEGNPAVGAEVRAQNPIAIDGKGYSILNRWESAVTDEKGWFKVTGLPEGYIHLRCTGDWHSKTTEVKLRDGKVFQFGLYDVPADDIRLVATSTGTIRGKLLDKEGRPVSGRVHLVSNSDPIGRWTGGAQAGEDGAFEIFNVPPDDYLLGTGEALERGEDDPTAQELALKPGKVVEVELVVP